MLVFVFISLIYVWFVECTPFPNKTLGFYCLIADDTVTNYSSTSEWTPQLYDYQMTAFNVLWLTFINPKLMPEVPPAMVNLAKCKGQSGCPPQNVPIILSIGGEAYSRSTAYWPWLQSESDALSMATEVASWDTKYGIDGIDLDLEGPAGNNKNIANNLVLFAQQIRKLNNKFIITQPVYGEPQIKAENDIVIASYTNGKTNNLISSVGIMVYNGLYSLTFIPNYTGSPYHVPSDNILPGFGGAYPASDITQMANDVVQQNLGGFMVWFASVWDKTRNTKALSYGGNDATIYNTTTGNTWGQALKIMTK